MANDHSVTSCEYCHAEAANILCWACTKSFLAEIRALRTLVAELDIQITRQSVSAKQPGGTGGKKLEHPILFNVPASELLDDVLADLGAIIREAGINTTRAAQSISRIGKARVYCNVIEAEIVAAARVRGAYARVRDLKVRILGAIDSPRRKKAIAMCPECDRGVFAFPDDETVTCCNTGFDVGARLAQIEQLARERPVTAKEAEQLTAHDDVRLNSSTIRSWVRRGQLDPIGPNYAGREQVFRFGDLLDLARGGNDKEGEKE